MELRVVRRDKSEHVILFDDADADLILTKRWFVIAPRDPLRLYAVFHPPAPDRDTLYMHRLLLPDTHSVDHINHNGLDNRRVNLRPATNQQQQANKRSQRNSTSAFKGVCWQTQTGKWVAQITVDGRNRFLGRFTSEEEAAHVYDAAAREAFGEYALTNFTTGNVRRDMGL